MESPALIMELEQKLESGGGSLRRIFQSCVSLLGAKILIALSKELTMFSGKRCFAMTCCFVVSMDCR